MILGEMAAASTTNASEWMMDLYDCLSSMEVISGGRTMLPDLPLTSPSEENLRRWTERHHLPGKDSSDDDDDDVMVMTMEWVILVLQPQVRHPLVDVGQGQVWLVRPLEIIPQPG